MEIKRYLYIFYSFVFLLHICNVFLESEGLNYLIGILAIVMLIVSFPGASRLFKILGIAFLIVGGAAFMSTDDSILMVPSLITSNMGLLTLLAMLPWMNSVVKSGRFDRTLNNMLNVKAKNLGVLYPRSSLTTLTLASFLNLSAATISQNVLKETLSKVDQKVRNSFIGTATLRGYTLALIWSPLEVLLALPIFLTGVNYVTLLPWLLFIAFIAFLIDSLWGRLHYKKYTYHNPLQINYDSKKLIRKLLHLIFALIVFLAFVIVIGSVFQLDFIFTVTILVFPYAWVWASIMKRVRSFWIIGFRNWKHSTNTMQNFIVLFISLAFFANSLNGTEFLEYIQQPVLALSDYPLLMFFIIQLIFILLSLFGVHPLGTIGMLSGIIPVLLEIMNPLSIAIVLVSSAVAILTVGPYGLVVQLTTMNTGTNPYRLTLKNMPYALMFGGIGSIVAYFLL